MREYIRYMIYRPKRQNFIHLSVLGAFSQCDKFKFKNFGSSATWLTEQDRNFEHFCYRFVYALYKFGIYSNNPNILGSLVPAFEIRIVPRFVSV